MGMGVGGLLYGVLVAFVSAPGGMGRGEGLGYGLGGWLLLFCWFAFALHVFCIWPWVRGVGFVSMTGSDSWNEYTVLKLLDRFLSVSMRVSVEIRF